MKKFATILVALMMIAVLVPVYAQTFDLYAKVGLVTDVDYTTDTITITDIDGHMWQWEGAEDWDTYDIVCFILCDVGTDYTREDDEIISITYNGYIEPNEAQWFWEISKG